MKKEFSKEKFSRNQTILASFILLAILLAIASIVCAFTLNNGFEIDKGNDPKDYYGTYYGLEDGNLVKLIITEETFIFEMESGLPFEQEPERKEWKKGDYEYVSAKYAEYKFKNSEFIGCDAVVCYENDEHTQYIAFWIISKDNGEYIFSTKTNTIFTKEPVKNNNVLEPEDFDGVYYSKSDTTILKLTITKEKIKFEEYGPGPFSASKGASYEWNKDEYAYVSADYAQKRFPNEKYEGKNAIFCKTEGNNGYIFWVISNQTGNYVFGLDDYEFTKKVIEYDDFVKDPKNYYGKYQYSEGNVLTIDKNNKCTFIMNGETIATEYVYADYNILDTYFGKTFEYGIICYVKNTDSFYIFEIKSNNLLELYGEYEFKLVK